LQTYRSTADAESESLKPFVAAMQLLGMDVPGMDEPDEKVNTPLIFQNHRPNRLLHPPPLHNAQDEVRHYSNNQGSI